VDCIAQHEGQDLVNAWHWTQAIEGLRIVGLGALHEIQRQISEQVVVVADQREVHGNVLLDGWPGKPLSHAFPIRFIGQLLADLGQIILAIDILHMGQQLGPCAHQRHPAPAQIPRGPHGSGIDISRG
jgi:hypothetical protein